jgi:hypothetical protein
MRAGVSSLESGAYEYVAPILQAAHDQIETIYADDPVAKKARSKFTPDATKDFKGDAYERAMLGYYLGIGYLYRNDLENARAAFRWGEFQDTMSASEQYQSDMGALTFLKGWVAQCQGEHTTANEEMSAASRIHPTLASAQPDDNVLVIVETGDSPIKYTMGKYNEGLRFKRGVSSSAESISVSVDEQSKSAMFAEDV